MEYPGFSTTAAWSLAEQGKGVTHRWITCEGSQRLPWDGDWEFLREGKVFTCSPLYQGHVVEVSVFSQAGLYHILRVGQLLRGGGGGGMMAPVPCGSWKGAGKELEGRDSASCSALTA